MRRLFRMVLLLVVLGVVLFILKPDINSFEKYLHEHYTQERVEATGDNIVEKLVNKSSAVATEMQVWATRNYHDYYVFAIVDADANSEKIRFLGIATKWIKLP